MYIANSMFIHINYIYQKMHITYLLLHIIRKHIDISIHNYIKYSLVDQLYIMWRHTRVFYVLVITMIHQYGIRLIV